jgi:hypothetical protein
MRGRLCRIAFAAVVGAGALAGCVQMTRHSNTMVFGTNTSFGIKVGADATATPGITVGYSRQEAVIMPLVANTGGTADGLLPCPVGADGTFPVGCLLVGQNGSTRGDMRDAYSVFASFGTRFSAKGTNPEASGQIAQYFATGVAAQKLAEAGAATIALGSAAAASSEPEAIVLRQTQIDASEAVATKVEAASDASFPALLDRVDVASASGGGFKGACTRGDGSLLSKPDCAAAIRARSGLRGLSSAKWSAAAAVN